MTLVANVDLQLLASAACGKRVTATAFDGRFLIVGVDAVFHGASSMLNLDGGRRWLRTAIRVPNPMPEEGICSRAVQRLLCTFGSCMNHRQSWVRT